MLWFIKEQDFARYDLWTCFGRISNIVATPICLPLDSEENSIVWKALTTPAHHFYYIQCKRDIDRLTRWFLGYMAVILKLSWWRHQKEIFPRYRPFVRESIRHRWIPFTKGKWRGALVFSLIWAWTNGSANNRDAGWFETSSRSIWRHYNGNCLTHATD